MLIKTELKKVPLCECPKFTKRELSKSKYNYLATAKICEIRRCGKILVVDYYNSKTKELKARFFCDKKNYISYLPLNDEWSYKNITSLLSSDGSSSGSLSKSDDMNAVCDFLDVKKSIGSSFWVGSNYFEGILGACGRFVSDCYERERIKAQDRKYERMSRHFSYFPKKYPESVDFWADSKAFGGTYIFFSNLDKKHKRKGLCGHCGKTFVLPANIKHNQQTECPKCHSKAIYCAERYIGSKKDKALICYPFKHENQLCLEWSEAIRTYSDKGKPNIRYDAKARTLYLVEKDKKIIYSYGFQYIQYFWGSYWSNWGQNPVYRKAFTFSDDLNNVFGNTYYNVDLKKIVENESRPFDFIKLLDNLKNIPQSEYLCKLGLTALTSELSEEEIKAGKNFSQCLGVNQQYLSMYRDFAVTASEHCSIKIAREYVTPEWLKTYRALKKECDFLDIDSFLPYMSLNKFFNYTHKQLEFFPNETLYHVSVWLRDYIRMSEDLNVVLSKSNMFPKNIKKAHDEILNRYNQLKAEEKEQSSKDALSLVNDFFKGYEKDGYTVLVPKEKADFIREGQELSHCVGRGSYYESHIMGERMIFFIRRSKEPQKAFYTAEIDMFDFRVLQLYGYGDKRATPEIKAFTAEFSKWLKTQKQKLRKAG